jgi:hypothetical protein
LLNLEILFQIKHFLKKKMKKLQKPPLDGGGVLKKTINILSAITTSCLLVNVSRFSPLNRCEMEESNSPVLSCKKFGKKTHVLPESPILSCGRKRKKPLPDDSPVFLRTTRTIKSCNESPVIDSFSSPPPIPKLKPKTLFPEVDDAPPSVESQLSQASSSKCNDHIIDEEDSSSTGSEDDLIVHERTMSDSEDRLDVTAS